MGVFDAGQTSYYSRSSDPPRVRISPEEARERVAFLVTPEIQESLGNAAVHLRELLGIFIEMSTLLPDAMSVRTPMYKSNHGQSKVWLVASPSGQREANIHALLNQERLHLDITLTLPENAVFLRDKLLLGVGAAQSLFAQSVTPEGVVLLKQAGPDRRNKRGRGYDRSELCKLIYDEYGQAVISREDIGRFLALKYEDYNKVQIASVLTALVKEGYFSQNEIWESGRKVRKLKIAGRGLQTIGIEVQEAGSE